MEIKGSGFKRIKYGTNAVVVILLAVGILAVINAFSFRNFFRIDLTEDKQFTVSQSTKNILAGLDDIVTFKVYLSKQLPPYMVSITDEVKDLLEEYKIYAGENLDIEYIDPAEDPAMEQKMRFLGIPKLTLNIIEKDKAAVVSVYMALAILYGDNKEVIPALTDPITLEYELTAKILRATTAEDLTIGYLAGHGEPDFQKQLGLINNELKEQYFTRIVETSRGEKVPDHVAALIVASPKRLSERDLFEIDQYIMSGGRVIFLIDGVAINNRTMTGIPHDTPLRKLLEHYGVKISSELVLDRLNANAQFQSGPYDVMVPYPFWVRVVRESIEGNHPIFNNLESMVLPWTSPLEIIKEKTADKNVAVIARSTEYSWVQKGFYDLSPKNEMIGPPDLVKHHDLAVAISGRFQSFFTGKSIPRIEEKKGAAAGEIAKDRKEIETESSGRNILEKSPDTKIVVVGNSRFITGNFPAEFDGNRAFFLNAIDWFTIGDQLIDIRSRETGARPLKLVPDEVKTTVRFVNMFGVSVLLAVFGLIQFYFRRRRKRRGAQGIL